MNPRITVVGSINMDLVFRTERMPGVGETITGLDFAQVPGGKGANQAVAAARQGADVHFVGAIGADKFGEQALACLRAEGISVDRIAVAPDTASGVAGIFVDSTGANSIVVAPGANMLLTVEQVEQAAQLIVNSACLVCQLESPMASVARAIELARHAGVTVVFNPAPALDVDDRLLACVDYLVVNETEAEQLSGIAVTDRHGAARAAANLHGRGARVVLLTMGAQGVLVSARDTVRFIPAVPVKAVDTTAAGDTFVGALTVALARGGALEAAVEEAQHAAALAVTRAGAQTSIPHRSEVLELMQQRRDIP